MKQWLLGMACILTCKRLLAQQTPFERSSGKQSATYQQAIGFYKKLDQQSSKVFTKAMDTTDAGYPLHLALVSNDGNFDPAQWKRQHKVVVLINNGIHPGEPDGIDASMLLVRDIVRGTVYLPSNVVLAILPVYNIGGALNRGSYSRVNQNGPLEYGFRGNAQNLDLNRDFTKCDSREARAFAKIFHWVDPHILIDNHVSDGADYQHTLTLLTTQYDKLGPVQGPWLKRVFEPALYQSMAAKQWPMIPYVNFETATPAKGWNMFYDPPRYSSGYAALFQTIGFVPETHMLKPFADRVKATYAFMQTLVQQAAIHADSLLALRDKARLGVSKQSQFHLRWQVDSSASSSFTFKGYAAAYKKSAVTGAERLYYDHAAPFTMQVQLFDFFRPVQNVVRPSAYLVPQGWHQVIELLRINGVQMKRLAADTTIAVEVYRIIDYKSLTRPYEKHHKNYAVQLSTAIETVRLLKGDYWIPLNQPANRYIVEMLEPAGDDSFFAWNFFDAVMQQKEGYSDYRWEDVAADWLAKNPVLQQQLLDKKAADTTFAANPSAQLEWVYQHSVYYEPVHMRYPVYRLVR